MTTTLHTSTTAAVQAQLDAFLTDVLTTAVEGGINYWASINTYSWDCPPAERGATGTDQDNDREFSITLLDLHRAIGKPASPKVFKTALRKIRAGNLWLDLDEAGDFDADHADALFQIAIFGEVTYG